MTKQSKTERAPAAPDAPAMASEAAASASLSDAPPPQAVMAPEVEAAVAGTLAEREPEARQVEAPAAGDTVALEIALQRLSAESISPSAIYGFDKREQRAERFHDTMANYRRRFAEMMAEKA